METVGVIGSTVRRERFYFHMAVACALVAFIGFAPSYWVPMGQGALSKPLFLHVHGAIFFGWTLLFVYQSWLGVSGQTAKHREIGLLGVAWATAVAFMAVIAAYLADHMHLAQGATPNDIAPALAAALGNLAGFVPFIVLALCNTRRPDVHKRAMLVATIALLDAPVVRWLNLLNPPVSLAERLSVAPLHAALLADLLFLFPLIHDWRTRGRPHAVTLVGTLWVVAADVGRFTIGTMPAWQSLTRAFLSAGS